MVDLEASCARCPYRAECDSCCSCSVWKELTCDHANQPSEIAGYFFCVKFRTQKFNKNLIKMQKEKRNTFLYANSGRVIAHAPTRLVHTWQYSTYFLSDGNKTKTLVEQ